MPGVFLISLAAGDIATDTKPGQFIMVDCGQDFTLRRPISIHGCREGEIDILFRIAGAGTDQLSRKSAGDTVDILGPLGNGFTVAEKSKNALLVAGGMGIAPIKFLAESCLAEKKQVTMLLGAASKEQLYPLSGLPDIKIITATDDGSAGKSGMITDFIKDYTDSIDCIYACGPVPMYISLSRILESLNIPVQVSLEVRMGCGFGVCYGCTIKTSAGIKQVCTDGPVFNINEIDWKWLKIR